MCVAVRLFVKLSDSRKLEFVCRPWSAARMDMGLQARRISMSCFLVYACVEDNAADGRTTLRVILGGCLVRTQDGRNWF
jgi:hypothetical protein